MMLSCHLYLYIASSFLTQISEGLYFSSLRESSSGYKSLSFDDPLFSQLHQSLPKSLELSVLTTGTTDRGALSMSPSASLWYL